MVTQSSRLPRPVTPPGLPPPEAARPKSVLSYGTVCSSNINRSMEAHVVLGNAGESLSTFIFGVVFFAGYRLTHRLSFCDCCGLFAAGDRFDGRKLWNRNASEVSIFQCIAYESLGKI
jgi:hypothetical protein